MTCFSGGTLDVFVEPQQPQPRLVVIGHLPTAQALAHLGKAMSYRVIAVDPETDGAAMTHADEVLTDLDEVASRINPLTFVVVASHGHFDEAALERVLKTSAPYVGLVASGKRSGPILDYLRQQGFGDDELGRVEVPAGLDIGARRGDEIALSIMAEIVQIRRCLENVEWVEASDDGAAEGACCGGGATAEPQETSNAVDPVCGMTVTVAGARHVHEHGGAPFYFCCGGCLTKFAADPESFLAA